MAGTPDDPTTAKLPGFGCCGAGEGPGPDPEPETTTKVGKPRNSAALLGWVSDKEDCVIEGGEAIRATFEPTRASGRQT
jgi:hypothetical protein